MLESHLEGENKRVIRADGGNKQGTETTKRMGRYSGSRVRKDRRDC